MNKTILYIVWAGMFLLCAVLGFVPEPEGFTLVMMIFLGLSFFVAPYLLLWKSWQDKDKDTLRRIGLLALLSLGLSFLLMVANLLSVLAPTWVGNVLYWALVILGTPMMCSRVAMLSLLLWAGLLFGSMELLRMLRKEERK